MLLDEAERGDRDNPAHRQCLIAVVVGCLVKGKSSCHRT